jgi:hypothetical protein
MKPLLLLFLPLTTSAQTCLTAIEVRKVNDLLDSYEALQEDSATFVKWMAAYNQCETLRTLEAADREDLSQLLEMERTRSKALDIMLTTSNRKAKRRSRLVWILGGVAVVETVVIGVAIGTR